MLKKKIMMDFYCDMCGTLHQVIADEEIGQPDGWCWFYHGDKEILVCKACVTRYTVFMRDIGIPFVSHYDESAYIQIGRSGES